MAFAVSEFKTNLAGGGARPSLFSVDIDSALTQLGISPPASSRFLIKGASILHLQLALMMYFITVKRFTWPVIVLTRHGIQLS